MRPVVGAVWNLGEPFIHRVVKEVYQRIGKEVLKGDRRPVFPCRTVRYALAGPLSDYARGILTPPSLADALMSSVPPRLGPVLVCTPTLESVPPPPVIIEPTPPVLEEIAAITTTDGNWTNLVLFLAGAALLVLVAHKLHQHRLANDIPVDESDDNDSPTPADSTTAALAPTESSDNARITTDSAAASVTPTGSDSSDFWFVFFAVVVAIFIV